ncbi:nuclear polyadenylated RNA-binding protein 3 [Parahypoxylon ruwenzoriense]
MTDKSPELLATADLTPVSPAPLHPSSPIVVPSLQDQADTLCTMSLTNNDPVITPSAPNAEQAETADRNGILAINSRDDAPGTNVASTASSHDFDLEDDSDEDLGVEEEEYESEEQEREQEQEQEKSRKEKKTTSATDEEGITQHPSHQGGATEVHQDVSKTIESTLSSDTSQSLTNHSELVVPAHEVSSTSVAQSVPQSAPNPSLLQAQGPPQGLQEPQEPQGRAVVATSSTGTTGAPQPPTTTDAPTKKSDYTPNATNNEIDIQSLVDKIIGNAPTSDPNQMPASQTSASLSATSQTASLPPRPPMPQPPAQSYVRPEDALIYQQALSHPNAATPSSLPPPPGTYPAGAPGIAPDGRSNFSPLSAPTLSSLPAHSFPVPQFDPAYIAAAAGAQPHITDQSQRWETFLQEERRYVSEAKWDRFPEGSRLFIGNLSSDRVSKKEVFDIFSKYGRLAQISLKQAYGFVQYHTLVEGQAAMDNLQGIEVRGRKIHLEFSRTQKKDGDGDKRGNRNKRDNERQDGGRGRRDDYRPGPGRQPSPRRTTHRQQGSYDSGRSYYDSFNSPRGRSRSPSYGRRDSGHYRRRSPSPYRRHPSEADLDIPRRYGGDIPDVQFLLLQEVERGFVSWAERAFVNQGLKVHVIFLNPHFPRDAVIQRQVMEGVHAVVELDFRAQQSGSISLQVFDRSAGRDNVRYDQYRDLDPSIAAQLVTRAKSQAQMQPYGVQYPPAQHYPPPAQPPYLAPSYASQPYPAGGAPAGASGGSLDNATLQKILGTLHGQQGVPHGLVPGQPVGGGPVDMNSFMTGYGGASAAGPGGPSMHHNANYATPPANGAPGPPGSDSAQHVQNIMAQLARYRQ